MEKEKDELLNFAFNEQDDKLKFYRETLVEMTKEAYRKKPKELKTEEAVEEGELLTKAIMKKVDEYEVAMKQHFALDEKRVNYYFGGDNCVAKDFTCTYPNFFKGVNPDYFKTEPIRTIVDNGPQYQPNQKSYGTLGEHWEELMELFRIKVQLIDEWKSQFAIVINNLKNGKQAVDRLPSKLDDIYKKLGIEFIEDFVKACEKCEE